MSQVPLSIPWHREYWTIQLEAHLKPDSIKPAFSGMERMCKRHGINQNSHSPVLVRKPLRNQFIHYHISSRGFFSINHFKLHNFAVVSIECSFATVDRGSIMAKMHRWSVMIYGSLQAELMKYNSHIHSMEHLSLLKLLLIYLNRLTTIIKYFGGCKIELDSTIQVFFLHRKQDFSHFCSIACFINSCMT